MAKEKIQTKLKNVSNTTQMVRNFINLVKDNSTNAKEYFIDFKALYSEKPYYAHVKESILEEVELIGMDVNDVNDFLSN